LGSYLSFNWPPDILPVYLLILYVLLCLPKVSDAETCVYQLPCIEYTFCRWASRCEVDSTCLVPFDADTSHYIRHSGSGYKHEVHATDKTFPGYENGQGPLIKTRL
jgi:hypothetical protein